jgi:16S rRNA (cytidine1402-2'-O)-methyltransferase
VIAPPQAAATVSANETDLLLRQALARVSLKDAVGEVADVTGLPRRELYQRALALAKLADKETDHGAPR